MGVLARGGEDETLAGGQMGQSGISAEEIYSAFADDNHFKDLPVRLAKVFGGRSSVIHWHHGDGTTEVLSHSGHFSTEQLLGYTQHCAQEKFSVGAPQRRPPHGGTDARSTGLPVAGDRDGACDEFLQEIAGDTYRCLGVRTQTDHGSGMIAIQRCITQSEYDAGLAAQLRDVAVHLRRVLSVQGERAALRHQSKFFCAILNCIPHAAFAVDATGALIFANPAAHLLLTESSTFTLRDGCVDAVVGGRGQLSNAVRLASASPPSGSAMLVESKEGQPLLCTILPLEMAGRAKALIMTQRPAQGNEGLERHLRSLYKLTLAESAVARRLAQGRSLKDIASERNVSLATVRVQLKFLAHKMGCRRQAEVVSRISNVMTLHD